MSFLDLLDWEPRAVACSRGNIRTGMTYDAEVKFLTTQYVISTGHATRAAAEAEAQKIVDYLKTQIRAMGAQVLSKFKEAKP